MTHNNLMINDYECPKINLCKSYDSTDPRCIANAHKLTSEEIDLCFKPKTQETLVDKSQSSTIQ